MVVKLYFRSNSIGLNATVNHSSGHSLDDDDVVEGDDVQDLPRGRLSSTSQADAPVFSIAGDDSCDKTYCTSECGR